MLATTKLQFFGYGKLIISSFKGYNDTCLDTLQCIAIRPFVLEQTLNLGCAEKTLLFHLLSKSLEILGINVFF